MKRPLTPAVAVLLTGWSLWCSGCGTGGTVTREARKLPSDLVVPEPQSLKVAVEYPAEPAPVPRGFIQLTPIGVYTHGEPRTNAAEIAAYDSASRRLLVVNVADKAIDILDISQPQAPQLVAKVSVAEYGSPTSVAASSGLLATSVIAPSKRDRGHVVFFTADGTILYAREVGWTPDMLTFSPDGRRLLVANEGEPVGDYSFDPEGSVTLIDVSGGAESLENAPLTTLDFRQFNEQKGSLEPGVRITGPGASVAQDLEPEYIAVSPDSSTAWVSCQENNAIVVIDLAEPRCTRLAGLGFKDHSLPGNGLDASDKDKGVCIRPWPVRGMYQPDGMAAFSVGDQTWLITANDGKDRDYEGFNEERRVSDLKLDPRVFPNAAELQLPQHLGRLRTTSASGDENGDGLNEAIYSYGGRSFSLWTTDLRQIFDSGDQFERIVAERYPEGFNSDHERDEFDNRSDNKGPEPEGVAVGVVNGRTIAFIGLERIGGVMVFDVSDVSAPVFETYANTRTFDGQPCDLGPEGVLFLSAEVSPNGVPLLVLANEISGTTRIFRVDERSPGSLPAQIAGQ